MKVSVVIVSWNVREVLRANLARLFSLTDAVELEVFVVDNASTDATADMIRAEYPAVRLICNDWNAGFGAANNQALALATGDVILLLNPDMLVDHGAIETVSRALTNDPTLGVVGIRLTDGKGMLINNVRRFPDFASQFALLLKIGRWVPRAMSRYLARDFDYSRSQDVDQVRGAFFAFRRDFLDTVGYFDERFFLWFEEVDLCFRARRAGLRVRYLADASARDLGSRSFAQRSRLWKQWHFTRSMTRYFRKWHPWWQGAILAAFRPLALALVAVADFRDEVIKDVLGDIIERRP